MRFQHDRPGRRARRRWNVLWPATLVYEHNEYPCTITDISEMGARIETFGADVGPSLIVLRCDRFGSLEGRVQWRRGAKAGIRFYQPASEVQRRLKHLVPGLGRKEEPAAPRSAQPPRKHFGRLPAVPKAEPVAVAGEPQAAAEAAEVDLAKVAPELVAG
jgi:hypothetical protein